MHNLHKGKILVTGGAGFIGSATVWTLNQRGIEDIVVADFLGKDEKWRNLVPLRFSDYLEADRLRKSLLENENFLGDVCTVFHMGACSSTTETDASYLVENNYEYTRFLAHWALKNDARFLYASSAATYGDGEKGMDDKSGALSELRPLNMYGYSKQMFDLYAQRHGMLGKVTGLKFFNIFGPNENHKGDMRSVVHKAFELIGDTRGMQLFKSYRKDFKDGEQRRDFLYVKDAVNMTLHLAETGACGIFNIGSGEARTWLELVNPIFEALDLTPKIEFVDMPVNLREKYQYFTQADIGKLRTTGYEVPVTSLRDAVRETVREYLVPDKRLGE